MRRFLVLAWCLVQLAPLALAQNKPEAKNTKNPEVPLPMDPGVRVGKLPNGLTYYIRKNSRPEKRVDLRLVVNAGSTLEDPGQEGLAHFTEHMAFNGTKNFPKNELVSYLQTAGVRFGGDLNAFTSFDETVYILPIPSDKPELVDKGLLVLQDWAFGMTMDNAEIDKERGVIIEEWRIGQGAGQRMRDKYFPLLFKGSRYAERLPIGKKEVIEGFKYDVIKQFYKDWYRPDLMAIVAVGDIDVDQMEKKIKEKFGAAKAPAKPRKREEANVPDHKETYVSIVQDKEATNVQVQVIYKQPGTDLKTEADMRNYLVRQLYNGMLNARLDELRQSANPPFIFGYSGYTGFVRTKDAYFANALVNETGAERGLRTMLEETERVKRFGFTQGELDREKKVQLKNIERAYNERDKTESENYVDEYVDYYLEGTAAPGIEFEYQFYNKYLSDVQLAEVNALAKQWVKEENRVVIITAPDKPSVQLPTEARVRELLAETAKANLKPYEDKAVASSLLPAAPMAGKVTAEKKLAAVDVTEFTLSNGARVVLKPTTFKNDEVLFQAYSFGGTSLYSDADYFSASNLGQIVTASGVGQFSATDLTKTLAGKTARVGLGLGETTESMNGNSSVADLETMFQLIHLYFTQPRKDAEAYNSFMTKMKAQMQNMSANPQFYFIDQTQKMMYNNSIRRKVLPEEADFDKINLDRAYEIYRERFGDASDFTFMFVGSFEMGKIKPLIETYLASLPGAGRQETYKDLGIRPLKGMNDREVVKGTDGKSLVNIMFTGETPYSRKENFLLASTIQLLNIKLIESVREGESGVYGIGAGGGLSKLPYQSFQIGIQFPCSATNADHLSKVALGEVEKLQKDGPKPEDVQKVKEAQKREREVQMKENRFWLNNLASYYQTGDDPSILAEAEKATESLDAKAIQETAKKYFNLGAYTRFVLKPEQK
jgi:zinc protease